MKNPQLRWWQTAVFYQIYPRSFQDSNGDGVGDLEGIISRLPYLAAGGDDSLGVDALWISPFYRSPMRDFGYDISDHCDVDPIFGDLEQFKRLVAEAHRLGLRVVVDLVINHTSDEHPWFIEARQSRDNPKHDWYIWHPGKPRRILGGLGRLSAALPPPLSRLGGRLRRPRRPNNWRSIFEQRSGWWWNDPTQEYYLGTFTRYQPELDWRNPELKEAMWDVVRFWLDLGADGYRIDVINWFIKDDRFRSNPLSLKMDPDMFQKHIYDRNRPETHQLCREMRLLTDSYLHREGQRAEHERVLVGEVFTDDTSIAAAYHGTDDNELHMAFNFDFIYQPWSARRFYRSIVRWYESIPAHAWPNFTLSNHDQRRHFGRYARVDVDPGARARVAAAMLLTMRGTPFLYYGEEIGMENLKVRRTELRDPLGVRMWPLSSYGRDPERTPMQWDCSPNAGFASPRATPWLPVNPNYISKNLARQQRDPDSLWCFYRDLLRLRKARPELSAGEIAFRTGGEQDLLVYERTHPTAPGELEQLSSDRRPSGEQRSGDQPPPQQPDQLQGQPPASDRPKGDQEEDTRVLVLLNFADASRRVPDEVASRAAGGEVLFGTNRKRGLRLTSDGLELAGCEVLIVDVTPRR